MPPVKPPRVVSLHSAGGNGGSGAIGPDPTEGRAPDEVRIRIATNRLEALVFQIERERRQRDDGISSAVKLARLASILVAVALVSSAVAFVMLVTVARITRLVP
jgi:hypothetical protein